MIKIFFYLNFKYPEYINQITTDYVAANGHIKIQHYDSKKNSFTISNDPNKNNNILNGKIYYINCSLYELIEKLSSINNIQIKNRDKYMVNKVNVYTENYIENDVYIIL